MAKTFVAFYGYRVAWTANLAPVKGFGKLPTRPTKRTGTHANGWAEDKPSVELDAIAPKTLRSMVRSCIEQHIDRDQLKHLRTVEAPEREQLEMFGQQVAAGARA